jgi:type VI secretion system protein ImpA
MPLRADLLNPVLGDNPAGVSLRYDPITEKIKEARREDLDVPQGEWKTAIKAADYPLVIKLAGEAFAKRGKELQLAAWLVDAHVRVEGFGVLAPALRFLHDFLDQYWDTLYPAVVEEDDLELRAAPLDGLGAKLGEPLGFLPITQKKLSWLKYQESRSVGYEADANTSEKQQARETKISEGKITAEEFDEGVETTSREFLVEKLKQLNEGLAEAEGLSEFCDEKFGQYAPSFLKTRDAIEEIASIVKILINRKPAPPDEIQEEVVLDDDISVSLDSEVESNAYSETSESEGETDSTSSYDEISSALGERSAVDPSSIEDVNGQLAAICSFLRRNDPDDPTPYLLLRANVWGRMLANAPMIDRSAMEAPPSFFRVNLRQAFAERDWDKVLETTESGMGMPFGSTWLDLQRFTVKALEQRGSAGAARVVRDAFRGFLEGLGDILDLVLPDDTPAANEETKNWIQNFVLLQKGPPRSEPTPEETSSESSDSSFDFGSSDSTDSFSDSPSEPEPDLETHSEPEPAPPAEPEPFEVEENPPIIDAEEPPPSDITDEFQLALLAIKDSRPQEGLAMITKLLATERSGRARFRRRTQLAHLLLAAGKIKVARPMLDKICAEIEERHLEDWEESEALAYPLELLLRSLSPSDEEKRTELYIRICQLDPVRAVNCPT